ncbi:hypothetical protein E5288_WYG009157 [Bos mutus]|uniref:Uncharacterized protein n=1 Tax=Bos mutus TaxID=72004 RepID=A0A6B0QZK1_9CETA|nr:hypothetical protein [Bos mutus]
MARLVLSLEVTIFSEAKELMAFPCCTWTASHKSAAKAQTGFASFSSGRASYPGSPGPGENQTLPNHKSRALVTFSVIRVKTVSVETAQEDEIQVKDSGSRC